MKKSTSNWQCKEVMAMKHIWVRVRMPVWFKGKGEGLKSSALTR